MCCTCHDSPSDIARGLRRKRARHLRILPRARATEAAVLRLMRLPSESVDELGLPYGKPALSSPWDEKQKTLLKCRRVVWASVVWAIAEPKIWFMYAFDVSMTNLGSEMRLDIALPTGRRNQGAWGVARSILDWSTLPYTTLPYHALPYLALLSNPNLIIVQSNKHTHDQMRAYHVMSYSNIYKYRSTHTNGTHSVCSNHMPSHNTCVSRILCTTIRTWGRAWRCVFIPLDIGDLMTAP